MLEQITDPPVITNSEPVMVTICIAGPCQATEVVAKELRHDFKVIAELWDKNLEVKTLQVEVISTEIEENKNE